VGGQSGHERGACNDQQPGESEIKITMTYPV
jgi:hypothetical protein